MTPGQEYDVTVTAGGTEAPCTVIRVSDGVIVWRAAAGKNGVNGNPNGDVKTSGQNGGVSGIDNGGNGAAPLGGAGGAGGVGPGPVAGTFPGGGGAAALAGGSALGSAGATGLVRITAA